jgi:hypothetical protein
MPLPRTPEGYLLAFLVLLFLARMALFPIVMWDGRSVWLFNAHKLFNHGMMALADARVPALLWSHPDYPLFYTAWMSHFMAWGGAFNERMAALGIAVFFGATLALLWTIARAQLGRAAGAAITLWAFFAVENLAGGAYVDGFVMALSGIGALSLARAEADARWRAVAYVVLAACSLLKVEGLVVSALVLLAFGRFRALAFLAPAVGHRLFAKLGGIPSTDPLSLGTLFGDFFDRFAEALETIPEMLSNAGYTNTRFVLWQAMAAALVAAALMIWHFTRDKAKPKLTQPALRLAAAACAYAAVSFAVILAVPHDVRWLVQVTLDRLLLQGSALMIFVPLLLTARSKE